MKSVAVSWGHKTTPSTLDSATFWQQWTAETLDLSTVTQDCLWSSPVSLYLATICCVPNLQAPLFSPIAIGNMYWPLHCTVLHSLDLTVVHSTVLYWTALHSTALHYTYLHCTALHCTELNYATLHCTTLHCTALHCPTLNHITLHCSSWLLLVPTLPFLYLHSSKSLFI